jgi:hypothetical protein
MTTRDRESSGKLPFHATRRGVLKAGVSGLTMLAAPAILTR